ncbi:hypothetical protein F5Y10DRAFT_253403 [Nemania abortiva]|nr:hypothetical protein F5Y10DRAFT_253403 [Nemania abortiva]
MTTKNPLTVEQPAADLLTTRKPARIAIFLRKKSPLFSLTYDEVIRNTCVFLEIPHEKSQFLAVQKWDRLHVLVFDIFYDNYDPNTGHLKVDLPVLLVDYGKRLSVFRRTSPEFRETVNVHVAKQHNYHGWDAKPPYIEDQRSTRACVPTYKFPRDSSLI